MPAKAAKKCDTIKSRKKARQSAFDEEGAFFHSAPTSRVLKNFDRSLQASIGRFTLGVSPAAILYAYIGWWIHLAGSPGKQADLIQKAYFQAIRLWFYTVRSFFDPTKDCCIDPMPHDHRFKNEAWQQWPYNFIYQSFLLIQEWWDKATRDVKGLSKHHAEVVSFINRQILDIFSPSNFLLTNPEILETTYKEGGQNLVRGLKNFIEDLERDFHNKPPLGVEKFTPGETVALTEGKVVFRNDIMELIQYAPKTKTVHKEPILLISAWIMKYYILDLSPHNSLVKYLVENGYTVFVISWKNPSREDRYKGMSDYRELGIMAAIRAITEITGCDQLHAVGYCLGGALLTIAAAAMARENDTRLKSLTLFATQVDYKDAGELTLFVDESQVSFLESMMWNQGYLDSKQLSGAFQLLRSKDLIWSRLIHDYYMGKRTPIYDLVAWNQDSTRLPYRMHSDYLRKLFLENQLAEGSYKVNDKAVNISDISIPIFNVATFKDHISPWKSVYKLNLLGECDVTFVLTSGGHNAGIVSEPGHKGRTYQVSIKKPGDKYIPPEKWRETVEIKEGSWWIEWLSWLNSLSSPDKVAPPPMGRPERGYSILCDAPGEYVHIQ